ncbi:transposable element Tcb1 transposase [Trichonephila clavipes]|nr:transposable element Tcb1 transposase [Trichonephila clavipes]
MRICDRWIQEGTTDRCDRSHPPQCTTSRGDRQIVRMAVTDRSVTSRTVAQHIESRICHQHHDGRIRVWRHHGQRMLNSCVMHHHTGPAPGIMPARSPDLSPKENMWSMVAQRLTQITPPAATPNQLWQRVEAAWSAVPQEHIQSLFESMPRRVAAVISNNGGYPGY